MVVLIPMLFAGSALAGLATTGHLFQSWRAYRARLETPMPGTLVQVGEHQLHVHCTGVGTGPTVVLIGGVGGPSVLWAWVQPEVARFARVLAYDRFGSAWSDARRTPVTPEGSADELHELLDVAGEPGPYVLVGHSYGGLLARIFTARYPERVAGLVLVDSPHEDEFTPRFPAQHQKGQRAAAVMMRVMAMLARVGLPQLMGKYKLLPPEMKAMLAKLPPDAAEAMVAFGFQRASLSASAQEFAAMEAALEHVRTRRELGDLPLVVLRHGKDGPAMPGTSPEVVREIERVTAEGQEELARLSSRGELVVAANSGHEIMVDEPDLVIAAIRRVLDVTKESEAVGA